jgi:hypothetical protein
VIIVFLEYMPYCYDCYYWNYAEVYKSEKEKEIEKYIGAFI